MCLYISWHGVPLFFNVEKHEMDRVAIQLILQVCQEIDQCLLCTTSGE